MIIRDNYDLKTKFLHIDLSYDLKNNKNEYHKYFIIDKNGNKYIENNEDPEFQTFMSYEKDYEMCMNTDKKIARDENYNAGVADGIEQTQIEIAKTMLKIMKISKKYVYTVN